MQTYIKKWGDSCVIILSSEFMDINNLHTGDLVDISDIIKVNKTMEGGKKKDVRKKRKA